MTHVLLPLVFEPLSKYFSSIERLDGERYRLTKRPDSALDIEHLAAVVHDPDVEVRIVGETLEVRFVDAYFADYLTADQAFVDTGPYEAVGYTSDSLTLRRRSGRGPEIEVKNFATQDEEWRHFLAGDIDVVPTIPPGAVELVAVSAGVRLETVGHPNTVSLYVNVGAAPLDDVRLRRAIALGLDRSAVSLTAVRHGAPDFIPAKNRDEARALMADVERDHGHIRLDLLVITSEKSFALAALAIQAQLSSLGIDVQLEAVPPDTRRSVDHQFDLLLWFGGAAEPEDLAKYISTALTDKSHYVNPAYDDAVARKDWPAARAMLERDLPIIPLYEDVEVVAIDGRLCGGRPETRADLTWLADLHPCAP